MRTLDPANRLPKYVQLADDLRAKIVAGELRPEDRVPSLAQLREQWGISQNTVEKAHALLEQDGLIVRHQGRGTFVAAPKRARKAGIIGCYGCDLHLHQFSYYNHLLRGAQRAAEQAHCELLLLRSGGPRPSWENIDGVLCFGGNFNEAIKHLPPGMKCVTALSEYGTHPAVTVDDRGGLREATEYLLSLGHRRIAYLYAPDDTALPRKQGYRDAMRSAAIEIEKGWMRPLIPFAPEAFRGRGRETMQAWLREGFREQGCTALLCHNDLAAIGVLEALREAGIRVPADLSVVGYDSTDECEIAHPRLTSVAVPLEEVSARCAEMLLAQMEVDELEADGHAGTAAAATGTGRVGPVVLSTRIDVRDSTGPPKHVSS